VDEGQGVTSHVRADFADRRASTLLPSIVEPLCQRLLAHNLLVAEVMADTNYSDGLNYALLEARGITPWISVFGQYEPENEGFTYDKQTDCFTCPVGKPLPFKRFDSDLDGRFSKRYSAITDDCCRCLGKPTCIPKRERLAASRPRKVPLG
jgi:hypothetical protein